MVNEGRVSLRALDEQNKGMQRNKELGNLKVKGMEMEMSGKKDQYAYNSYNSTLDSHVTIDSARYADRSIIGDDDDNERQRLEEENAVLRQYVKDNEHSPAAQQI